MSAAREVEALRMWNDLNVLEGMGERPEYFFSDEIRAWDAAHADTPGAQTRARLRSLAARTGLDEREVLAWVLAIVERPELRRWEIIERKVVEVAELVAEVRVPVRVRER